MSKQAEALRLAFALESHEPVLAEKKAAAELRRQHALIADLVEALEDAMEIFEGKQLAPKWAARANAAIARAKEQQ